MQRAPRRTTQELPSGSVERSAVYWIRKAMEKVCVRRSKNAVPEGLKPLFVHEIGVVPIFG